MANENHEQYDGNDISTYTDVINSLNMMSPDFIDSCTLSAGLLPCDNPRIQVTSQQSFQQGANSLSPFYFDGGGNLWFDETELSDATDSRFQYLHIVYAGISDNQIASSLKVQNYRNFVTITQHTETINGTPYNYYELGLTTKCGDNNDPESTWTNSVLKPMYVIPENNMRTGFFAEEVMCVQECDFGSGGTHGRVCTNLNYQQGRRNLIDGSGNFIEKAIWYAGLGLPQGYHISGGTQYGSNYDHHLQWQNNPSGFYAGSVINNEDDLLMLTAICGLKFEYDNVLYKPIVEGGVVTGYTSDMTQTSEWDTWEDIGDHEIPVDPHPVPPPPSPDEDNDDPIPTVGAPYSSGLARYYVTTAGSTILNHISEAMGAWNLKDSGKDLYRNIISCKLIKSPAPIPVSGSEPFTVYGVTLQYEGADITLSVINDNPTASFGSYNIPRKFNDFRDYAPYTKVEIYLPYCGWTVLPSHVVGRSVSVTYYTDIIAATCKAVVYCGTNVVAEAAGVIGLDIPMVTENAGAKAEAVTMGLLAYGKAGLQTALGVGAAVATKGKAGVKSAVSGLENLVSAYSQTAMAFNQNYTEINGKNGDGCCIAGISAIVIKITRPKYGANTTAPYVPSEYGHATGFVSMKSAKVGSFTGLLVADNVDTSGISGATDREKQLIKLYLESGIYVNHPS